MRSKRFKNPDHSDQATWNTTAIITWILAPFVVVGILRLLNFLGS